MIHQATTDRPSAPAAKSAGGFVVGSLSNLSFRQVAKWCGCVLVLLTPGTFVIIPALWLIRRVVLQSRSCKSSVIHLCKPFATRALRR